MPESPTTDPGDLRLDHQVDVDPFSGSATITVPLRLSAARDGFGPQLVLGYDSAAGNGPLGLGWSLGGLLSISVDTRKRLPRYDGSDDFTLSAAGELVPALRPNGPGWEPWVDDGGAFWVRRYRPLRERAFWCIEQWTEKTTRRVHWRTTDARNALTVYGLRADGSSRVADPGDPARTFTWLPDAQYDASGNGIVFEYAPEDRSGVDVTLAFERARGAATAQRYLKRIAYGNTKPLSAGAPPPVDNRWAFEVVFDYGDHDLVAPSPAPSVPWAVRPDAFSTYRPGFEVRTYRLCRRVLQFHRFPQLGTGAVLTGAYAFDHDGTASGSTLRAIGYTGFRTDPGGVVSARTLPPLTMTYAAPVPARDFVPAQPNALVNVPSGLGGGGYRWVDLYGEGLPGILSETGAAWYYKSNEGGGSFGPQQVVATRPACSIGECVFNDFDADGNTDVAVMHGRDAGYFRFDRDAGVWDGFRPFPALPHLEGAGTFVQWLDLDGDGRADLLVADPMRVVWFANLGKDGFAAPVELPRPKPSAQATPLAEDLALDWFFADMTGDGLPDHVLVRNGRVEYCPHLGNGRFGDPVLMEGAPMFAPDWAFDARRVLLVDLDGTGGADIVYVGAGEVRYWYNAGGNRLVEGGWISGLPYIDNVSSARVFDFLGDGTPALVWSSPLAGSAHAVHYLPLTNGIKPRLLLSVDNSMGLRTELAYSSSAVHYVRDKRAGRPWRTKLPSHRVVVDRKTLIDAIGAQRSVTRYEYHDGSYDGEKRTFGGFSAVDQYDADAPGPVSAPEDALTAPACLRTWFHHGRATRGLLPGAYAGDASAAVLVPQTFERLGELQTGEFDDGLRALAGLPLRTELFALEASGARAPHPFQVVQHAYALRRLQPARGGREASFAAYAAQTLTYAYEQDPADPRVTHALALAVDDFGHVTRECSLAYARRSAIPADASAQRELVAVVRERDVANVSVAGRHELAIPLEVRELQLAGLALADAAVAGRERLAADLAPVLAAPLAWDAPFAGGLQAKLTGRTRFVYWNDAADAPLPPATVGARALLHHEETACFTPGWIAQTFGPRVGAPLLAAQGYRLDDGYWWKAGDVLAYRDASGFFQRAGTRRADGSATALTYDDDALFVVQAVDAAGNTTRVETDRQSLAPARVTDPNGNVSETAFDALRVAVVTTVSGQVLDGAGQPRAYGHDPLAAYVPRPGATFASVLADPAGFVQNAARYVFYDLDAWAVHGLPTQVVTVLRERYAHDGTGAAPAPSPVHVAVQHVDGFGGVLQSKTLVEPGPAPASPRWLADGHVLRNRKQLVVRQYEPFFSATPSYEGESVLPASGTFRQLAYDAAGRPVRTDFPNGTLALTEYRAWETRAHDPNDTVLLSAYRTARESLPASDPEQKALAKAEAHAGTPTVVQLDPLGRDVRVVAFAAPGDARAIETVRDVRGNAVGTTDQRGQATFAYRFDMADRPLFVHSADAGDRWTLLDAHDRAAHEWNARGVHLTRRFDALDRPLTLAAEGLPGLANVVQQIVYGDDPSAQDPELRNLRGRPMLVRDQAGTVELRRYDPAGAPLHVVRQLCADYKREPDWGNPASVALDPARYESLLDYDALGRPRTQTLPDGTTRTLRFLQGRGVAGVRVTSGDGKLADVDVLAGVEYGARGERTRAVFGNGVELVRAFEARTSRVARITARRPAAGPGAPAVLQDLRYTYDPAGNVVFTVDGAQVPGVPGAVLQGLAVSPETEYTYDALYQLTAATGRVHQALLENDYRADAPGAMKGTRHITLANGAAVERYTRSYAYDRAGNLTQIRHAGVSRNWTTNLWVSASSNRALPALDLTGSPVSDPEAAFDAAGNTIALPHLRALDWSYRNTVSRAVLIDRSAGGLPDDAEYYVYDAAGARVRKVRERLVDGDVEITETLYFDGGEIKRIRRKDNLLLERTTSHVSDGTVRVALIHRWTADTQARETSDLAQARIRYQLTDHLGSSLLELDGAGAVITYEEYFPYGGAAFIAGDDDREVALKDYRFCGKERDDATGFAYFTHRYYAPWLGRWISPDPIGPASDANLYRYCYGDPVNLFDPDGLQTTTPHAPGQRITVRTAQAPEAVVSAWHELPEAQRTSLERTGFVWHVSPRGVEFLTPRAASALQQQQLASGQNVYLWERQPERPHRPSHRPAPPAPAKPAEMTFEAEVITARPGEMNADPGDAGARQARGSDAARRVEASHGAEHGDDASGSGARDAAGTSAGATGTTSPGDAGATGVHAADGGQTGARADEPGRDTAPAPAAAPPVGGLDGVTPGAPHGVTPPPPGQSTNAVDANAGASPGSSYGPGIAAANARSTVDALQRVQYERAIKGRSAQAVGEIEALRQTDAPGDAVEAWEAAKDASEFREATRSATRNRMSAPGRTFSDAIDQTHPRDWYVEKYSSPPELRPQIGKGSPPVAPQPEGAYVYEVAEDVARAAGKSRGGIPGALLKSGRYLGPIGIAVGVGLSAREIYNAPEGQRGRVAAREVSTFAYALVGAEAGGIAALAIAAVILGATPVGWVAFGIAAAGALVGGYLFGKLGATTGQGLFDLFSRTVRRTQ